MSAHRSFNPEVINRLQEQCEGIGKEYVLQELDEETASFQFVGEIEGKPVAIDAFLYTLELEFYEEIINAAKDAAIDTDPSYANADFDAAEGPHIDLLEEIIEELSKDEDFMVKEFITTGQEDNEEFTLMEVCLNIEEVTEAAVKDFVTKYKNETLELDDTFYSFSK